MKKTILSIFLACVMVIVALPLTVIAVDDNDITVYSKGSISISNSSLVNGNVTVISGTYGSTTRKYNFVNGTIYKGTDATAGTNVDKVKVSDYNGSIIDYKSDEYNHEVNLADFNGCKFSDGTKDLTVTWWSTNDSTVTDGYTISENAYFNTLTINSNLTLNINAPKDKVLEIRAKTLKSFGFINLVGEGKVLLIVEDMIAGRNGYINANSNSIGNPDNLGIYFPQDVSLSVFNKIAAHVIVDGNLTVSVVDIYGSLTSTGSINFYSNGGVTGLVYAPSSDTTMNGSTLISGKLITKTLTMIGNAKINQGGYTYVPTAFKRLIQNGSNTVRVLHYSIASGNYEYGTINTVMHTPVADEVYNYLVFDENSFTQTNGVVTAAHKAIANEICDAVNDVFEFRSGEIVKSRFGRVDSLAAPYALTIAPYAMTILQSGGFDTDTMWLVMGNRNGEVADVWVEIS